MNKLKFILLSAIIFLCNGLILSHAILQQTQRPLIWISFVLFIGCYIFNPGWSRDIDRRDIVRLCIESLLSCVIILILLVLFLPFRNKPIFLFYSIAFVVLSTIVSEFFAFLIVFRKNSSPK